MKLKNPALARMLSIVTVLMGAVMLLSAALGMYSALKDRNEAKRQQELLVSRADEYEAILARDEGRSIPQTESELDRLREKHAKRRSDHLVKLATYTATKSGLKQGKDAMNSAFGSMLDGNNLESMVNNAVSEAQKRIGEKEAEYEDEINNIYADLSEAIITGDQFALDAYGIMAEDMANYYREYALSVAVNGLKSAASGVSQLMTAQDQMDSMELGLIRDSVSLSIEKETLEKEEAEIAELEAELAELKSDEHRVRTLRAHFTANEGIANSMKKGSDVLVLARNEAQREEKEYKRIFLLNIAENAAMALAFIFATLGVPAAFEKRNSRAALLAPAWLFLIFAAAADGISMLIDGEQQYAALFAAIFGAVYLLTLKKEKE